MSITAKELAQKLGISAAAVSIALNGKPGVSESTRERVLQAAREMDFEFRKLKSRDAQPQGTIAFLLYKRHGAVVGDTPFFSALLGSIADECRVRGYELNMCYIYEDTVKKNLRQLVSAGIRGVILLGTEIRQEDYAPFANFPLPLVVLDSYFEGIDRDCVLINNVQGAFMATNYLIQKRKRQPGYLRSSYSIGNFDERADGFYKAIRHNGLAAGGSIVHRLAPSEEGAYEDMKALLQQGEPVANCYFADNDLIAVGAMRAFQEAGYRIPEDIGIVGLDNIPLCEQTDPPLTTIHVSKQLLGITAVDRLCTIIAEKPSAAIKMEISTTLIRRGSA